MADTSDNTPKNKSQPKWSEKHKSDARKAKGTGSYPDYFSWKTRSGHTLQLDDTQGNETVTLQHRGGTAVQMGPDGSLHITAHNGKYEITFGENKMTVSGAQDITVKGDASLRIYGDYNVTCHQDYNLSVLGNFNLTAKNHNRHILGNIDTQARNENKRLMGSSAKIARGAIAYVAKGSTTVASQSDQVHIGGAAGINMAVSEGNINSNIEKGDFHSETKDGDHKTKAKGAVKVQSTDDAIQMQAKNNMEMKSESGDFTAEAASGNVQVKAQSKMDLRATGDASLSGSTTHVSGQTTHIQGSSTVNVDGPSALNLNGGLGQVMSALGLQMNFDFGDSTTGNSRGVHAPDRPAGNDEAKNWA